MKVSVVIAAYNAEAFIDRCLNSVIHQTYNNIEIVIVNDGSRDSTLEILNQYSAKDSRILVVSQDNSGVYFARKKGIQNSTGESIIILDSDDYLELNAVELLINKMTSEDADIVVGNHFHHEHGQKRLVQNHLPSSNDKVSLLRYLLLAELKGYLWGRLLKRELLDNLELPITVSLADDVIANFYIACNYDLKVVLVEESILNYIIHSSNITSSTDPIIVESVLEQNDVVETMLSQAGVLEELREELAAFKSRNWIIYCRMGGSRCRDYHSCKQFYNESYKKGKRHIPIYSRIEIWSYFINMKFGRGMTRSMKLLRSKFKV